MKRYALTACLILAACSNTDTGATVEGDTAAMATPAATSNEAAIRAATDKYFQTISRGTAEALDSLYHKGLVVIHGNGVVANKAERLEHHRAGQLKLTSVKNEILAVQEFGDDFALVHIRATSDGEVFGKAWTGAATMVVGLSRNAAGQWLVVYQQSVPEVKPAT
jgi:ketosteroid isomerase-like protein